MSATKKNGWFDMCETHENDIGWVLRVFYSEKLSVLITVVMSCEKTPQIKLYVWKWILISGVNVGIVVVLGLGHHEVMLESRLHEFSHCMFFFVYFLCKLLIDLHTFGEFDII